MTKVTTDKVFEKGFAKEPTTQIEELAIALEKANDNLIELTGNTKKLGDVEVFDSFEVIEKANKAFIESNKLIKTHNELAKARERLAQEKQKTLQAEIKAEAELEKAIQQENKTRQEAEKILQQQIKTEQLVAKGKRDEAKEIERIEKIKKRELAQQEKLNKKNAEQSRLSVKLANNLKDLKEQYKDLVLEEGFTAKGAKEIAKEITSLEKQLGKADKKLKDMKESGKDARLSIKGIGTAIKISGIALLVGIIAKITAQFKSSREGALEFQKGLNRITAFIKVFGSSIITAFVGIREILPALGATISNFFSTASKQAQILALDIASIFSSDAEEKANKLRKEIEELENSNTGLSEALDKITGSFDNYSERVDNVIEQNDILLDQTLKYTIEIENLERSLVKLTRQQELANSVADDATLGFQQRINASQEVARVNAQVAAAEFTIAEKRLQLSEAQIRAELAQSGITAKSRADILRVLKDQDLALKVSDEASREFTDNFIAAAEARTASEIANFEQSKQLRELEQDLRERDLDIFIDGFDNQKTINERRISNEKLTLAERRKILEETQRLSDDSLRRQVETLQMFTDEQIDINDLLATSDAVLLNQKIRSLGLSEILEGRLLEVIRDRRTATQDLTEANNELSESEIEANEIRQDIAAQQIALSETTNAKLEDLDDSRTQNEINNLRKRLDAAKDGSIEALRLQQELNDKLLQAEQERVDKEAEAAQQRKDTLIAGIDAVAQSEQLASEERLKAIDKDIEAAVNNQARLQEQLNRGVLDSSESLAEEEKAETQARAARLKEEEQQKKIQAGFDIISALVAGGTDPAQAVPQTAAILAALPPILRSFKVGTENTGNKKGPGLDGLGAELAFIHPNERILTAEQNAIIPDGLSNWQAATILAQSANDNKPKTDKAINQPRFQMPKQTNDLLQKIVDKPVYVGSDIDTATKIMRMMFKDNNSTIRNNQKLKGGIW